MIKSLNLLEDQEISFVEGVSKHFFYASLALAFSVFFMLTMIMLSLSQWRAEQNLQFTRSRWAEVEKRFYDIQEMQLTMGENKRKLRQVLALQKTTMRWSDTLEDIPKIMPPSVQLMSLKMEGRLSYLYNIEDPEDTRYRPMRKYSMRLEGYAVGANGENTIMNLVREIPESDCFVSSMDSANLVVMQRDQSMRRKEPVRRFQIDTNFKNRGSL